MHAEQANLRTSTPILTKKRSYLFEDFDIKLSWGRHGMGACDGSEIFIAQLELDGARVQATVGQAATHHLRESHQGSFQLLGISRVFIVGMLVADRLGISIGPPSLSNQPPASSPRALPASASPHFPKRCSRKLSSKRARSLTLVTPRPFRCRSVIFPTPGISRTSSGARKLTSCPGTIQRTPFALALADETLATSLEIPIPRKQLSWVSDFILW